MTRTPESWLDPEYDVAAIPAGAKLTQSDLDAFGRQFLGESLVAQRLITAGALALDLSTEAKPGSLGSWGHTLSSRVAVLLPQPGKTASPTEQRVRRKHQELLLRGQASWPDLASTTSTAFLICSDNQPPEIGLPAQLYPGQMPDRLLDYEDFHPLLDQMIRTVSPAVAPAWMHSKVGLREALATMVAETFKNTHDHARQEVDQSDVAHSLRGLYARYYDLDEIALLADVEEGEKLSPALRFARNFVPKTTPQGVRRPQTMPVDGVLEISVFDSGPGMAAKWLRHSVEGVPVQTQLDALLSCFAKGRTTTGTQGRGYGLAKVLMKLKELHGFIGVRTNQLQVYRQFGWAADIAHRDLGDGTRVPQERLLDWKRHLATSASERVAVKGTVVSFLLPMGSQ
jgi:hypothetical protein